MPVTVTAKRALRASKRKAVINKIIISKLEVAMREAKKTKSAAAVKKAISLADRAAKKKVIHKNKSARIRSTMAKLVKLTSEAKKAPKKSGSKK